MKERVHIHTLEVSGQGQIINFQVRIPRDAKRIVGILITENVSAEGGAPSRGARGVDISRPRITFPVKVGHLILQSKDKANFFYAEDVLHNDNSFSVGDFTIAALSYLPSISLLELPSGIGTAKREFTGGAKWQELCIEIDIQNTKLFGIYTDTFNESREANSTYQVKLYFYYEQKRIISNEN